MSWNDHANVEVTGYDARNLAGRRRRKLEGGVNGSWRAGTTVHGGRCPAGLAEAGRGVPAEAWMPRTAGPVAVFAEAAGMRRR
jgi:hypothetical protein